jgi:hypothetical protein
MTRKEQQICCSRLSRMESSHNYSANQNQKKEERKKERTSGRVGMDTQTKPRE